MNNLVTLEFYWLLASNRFIHPLTYGEYPKTMQEIVGDRLPKFTEEQVKLITGAYDFVGINQYTTYYMSNPQWNIPTDPMHLSYSNDWHAAFNCKCFTLHFKV